MSHPPEWYNGQSKDQWNQKALFWDEMHGDAGNWFHKTLVEPSVLQLLELQAGEKVLDLACGNGVLARRCSQLGAVVTACDFSDALIRLAKARSSSCIEYQVVDATDKDALLALGKFDAISCTMALMDISTIEPLFQAVPQMLNPGGRLVVSTAHPAFNSNNPVFVAELSDEAGALKVQHSLKLSSYFNIPPVLSMGAKKEPCAHFYYHRTLQEMLMPAFSTGQLFLDAFLEPTFPPEVAAPMQLKCWVNTPTIPPVVTFRLRKLAL